METAEGPLYTEQVEPVFNTHPSIRRTALVGVGEPGHQHPVLCYELLPDISASDRNGVVDALKAIAAAHAHIARIETFLCHPGFPVDIRHNAKIGREKLTVWATSTLKRTA